MIRFSLFGIPIEIQPFFWLMCILFSGSFKADSAAALLAVALFTIAALVSILVHELGHALTGRRLGGGYTSIALTAFGGLAYNEGGRFTRAQRFYMIAAGPGAGFALLAVVLAILSTFFGSHDVLVYASYVLFGRVGNFQSDGLLMFLSLKPFIKILIDDLIWINFWWGVLNLLPIIPLDGGRITELFMRPVKRAYQLGIIVAVLAALYAYYLLDSSYMLFLFGFLAWQNYKATRALN
jgi:stage IV sporulation protein FB